MIDNSFFATPSPIERLKIEDMSKTDIRFWVKRDDLIHSEVSGNKWRKLQFNLEQAKFKGKDTILTFGGAYSNHIAATAAACRILGLRSIGVIRGEEVDLGNPTLSKAQRDGMKVHRISREKYRNKSSWDYKDELRETFGDFYLIPEGGANFYGVQGCMEIMNELPQNFDRIFVACGTGTTLAGMAINNKSKTKITGVSVLKGNFMLDEVKKRVEEIISDKETELTLLEPIEVLNDYHFGGYAKATERLIEFMHKFRLETGVELDKVYTAKAAFAMIDQANKNDEKTPQNWLFLHTGGLQGNQDSAT